MFHQIKNTNETAIIWRIGGRGREGERIKNSELEKYNWNLKIN